MFKVINNATLLYWGTKGFYPNIQTVRWGRKPIWLPTAKSKLFKVAPRKKLPVEEYEELKRLHNNYRTKIKSIRKYFEDNYSIHNMEKFDEEQHKNTIEADFARCNVVNDEWNANVKVLREQRVNKELEDTLNVAKQRLQERIEFNAKKHEMIEEIVRREKEAAKDFITIDKIDSAIEYAINNPVDYNYALDLEGNKISGQETNSLDKKNQKVIVNQ